MTVKKATQTLNEAGFSNIQFTQGSSNDDKAHVMIVTPGPGTTADPNQPVTLTTIVVVAAARTTTGATTPSTAFRRPPEPPPGGDKDGAPAPLDRVPGLHADARRPTGGARNAVRPAGSASRPPCRRAPVPPHHVAVPRGVHRGARRQRDVLAGLLAPDSFGTGCRTSTLYFEVSAQDVVHLVDVPVVLGLEDDGSPFFSLSMLWNFAPWPSRWAASVKLPLLAGRRQRRLDRVQCSSRPHRR